MMSLKPRNVDFQETWANLKETVAGVVRLRGVERAVWNSRFSDVYALCVAHPEPLAARLYDETRAFLEHHVAGILTQLAPPHDLLPRYVEAWQEYSQGVAYLNSLYSYLNLQHIKRQKVSDAEIIYGASSTSGAEQESRQLEVGELGLTIWERVLVRPLAEALSARIVDGLCAARDGGLDPAHGDLLRTAIQSLQHVQSFRVRNPLALYDELVLRPYLQRACGEQAAKAAALLSAGDVPQYMTHVLDGLEREVSLAARFLHPSSREAARRNYEEACVAAHLPALHAQCPRLLSAASEHRENRDDLRRLYALLQPLGAAALRPLVSAAHEAAAREGRRLLAAPGVTEAPAQFVQAMLTLHECYSELFADVFGGAQAFVGALDRACSDVVNGELGAAHPAELLARYCDGLLRRRGAGCEADCERELARAIVVFKYVDDKDVFQKYYARALARRLIHQLSTSMEQEEAMINRLKAACGYEFTNKLHRMFTDVAVSADLNVKFQRHLVDTQAQIGTGFTVQVLQAGAWPLGGGTGGAGALPPAQLERPARLFEAFYRAAFSGRRLAWLTHLCTGELRTAYTARHHHLTANTHQCAILLSFETVDCIPVRELQDSLQLSGEPWERHVRPLLETGLLLHQAQPVEGDDTSAPAAAPAEGPAPVTTGTLQLNLNFTCKRSKLRLVAVAQHHGCASSGSESASEPAAPAVCDDDRKMYLQAAIVRIMKQRKVLRHNELMQAVVSMARGQFAPSVPMIKKCIEALIDKQYLERAPATLDTYSYLA